MLHRVGAARVVAAAVHARRVITPALVAVASAVRTLAAFAGGFLQARRRRKTPVLQLVRRGRRGGRKTFL